MFLYDKLRVHSKEIIEKNNENKILWNNFINKYFEYLQ
jgi:hypothetical protein